jgi:hypothetical protein
MHLDRHDAACTHRTLATLAAGAADVAGDVVAGDVHHRAVARWQPDTLRAVLWVSVKLDIRVQAGVTYIVHAIHPELLKSGMGFN